VENNVIRANYQCSGGLWPPLWHTYHTCTRHSEQSEESSVQGDNHTLHDTSGRTKFLRFAQDDIGLLRIA